MIAAQSTTASFFRDLHGQQQDFDGERFLLEVDARFDSEELLHEVRWRLEVLHELASQRGLEAEFEVLRDRLTQIFADDRDAQAVVQDVKALTHIEIEGSAPVDLRLYLVPERRVYNEGAYRTVLQKKIATTAAHAAGLATYYPDDATRLNQLGKLLRGLAEKCRTPSVRTRTLKTIEDNLRETQAFRGYEALKERLLRDWLARFARMPEQELALLGPAEIQRLVTEHARHQTTALVQSGVRPLDSDVSEHLGFHDTLEGTFRDDTFWAHANAAVRRGFTEWALRIVLAFGMVHGRRYAFFQSEAERDCFVLVGLGLPALPASPEEPLRLVPYIKPFTRKAGYLLEVRRRSVGDGEAYHRELVHYTLPFLFGFDQVEGMEVPKALRDFFNARY